MTTTRLFRILAWALLIGLVIVTLGPIGVRPVSHLPVQFERAMALALVGGIFALAYPRHLLLVAIIVLGSTVLLEAMQLLAPSRHGRVLDLIAKLAGAGFGLAVGHWLSLRLARKSS